MATLPEPYYAVIFSSERTDVDAAGYDAVAERMLHLAAAQPGYLGVESVRGGDGLGLTISYWQSREAIAAWKANVEHRLAQQLGREKWYARYRLRICQVQQEYAYHVEQA